MPMDAQRRIAALRSIHAHAQHLSDIVRPALPPPRVKPVEAMIPPVSFDLPSSVSIARRMDGIRADIAQELLRRIIRILQELQRKNTTIYRNACLNYLADGHIPYSRVEEGLKRIQTAHESLFNQRVNELVDDMLPKLVQERLESARSKSAEKKAPFNPEYIPLLEKYYELNPYPSTKDRDILAQKSGMDPRQIEVWFQNHRRRSRRAGRPPAKISKDMLPVEFSFESLEQSMSPCLIHKSERSTSVDRVYSPTSQRSHSSTPAAEVNVLESSPPTPSGTAIKFSQFMKVSFDPKSPSFSFASPVWLRQPTRAPKSQPYCKKVAVDDICKTFNQNLRICQPEKARRSKVSWLSVQYTKPLPAPLPALCNRSKPTPSTSSLFSTAAGVFTRTWSTSRPSLRLPHRWLEQADPPGHILPLIPRTLSTVSSRSCSTSSVCSDASYTSSGSSSSSFSELGTPVPDHIPSCGACG